MRYKLLLSIFSLLFLSAPIVHAQSVLPDPIQYIVSPENPGPNQTVTIEVNGVGMFLGNSKITWQQDGKTISAASGKESFTFTTGGVGVPTRVHLTIDSPTQGLIAHDFIFNPSVVSIVWEADTYTPLLYKGKALYTAGSGLRVVAFPTVVLGGALVPASKLSFQWMRGDAPDVASSGLGKNTFSFNGDQLQTGEDVSVTIYSGNTPVAKGAITIPASAPEVLLYAQDPLRGELLDAAFSNSVSLGQKEATFKAEPYFFANTSAQNGKLVYAWTLDSQETTGPSSAQGLLTLRQTGAGSGSAELSVTAQNTTTSQYVQSASASLHIVFGQQTGSSFASFFGL